MDLLPSTEQAEIVWSASAFLADTLPTERTRQLITQPSNVDAKAWVGAAELGWFTLGLSEDLGGIGCGLTDEVLLFREIGRSLASGPFLPTTLGARVAAFGGEVSLAREIGAGRQVAFGLLESGGTLGASGVTGTIQVVDASEADLVLVATDARAGLFSLPDLGPLQGVECVDPTTRLARVTTSGSRPLVCVEADDDPVQLRGMALAAALLTGIAEVTLTSSVDHAKNRMQFDRPIGVHQAVKHSCADMAVRAELAWAQTVVAALAIDEGRSDAELQCLSAFVVAADAAARNSAATVQIFGGMGFTFGHDVNLYVKRGFLLVQLLGSTRDALARLVQLPGPE